MNRKQYTKPTTNQRLMLIPERPVAETKLEGSRGGNVIIPYGGEDQEEEGRWADTKTRQNEFEENYLW